MHPLNLPPFEYNFKETRGKQYIFDSIRKKYLLNTPEEWVRQHFVNFLVNHRSYSKNLIKLETGLKYLNRSKRTDIQVFDRQGNLNILVECKAADIALNQKVLAQILQYHKVLNASILAVTNGIDHVFIRLLPNGSTSFLNDLPFDNGE